MFKQVFLISSLVFSSFAVSADIFIADRQFTEKNYEQARQAYLAAAELGNPHAYYQLGNMYYKGLGTKQDPINALLYFYLAAEQKFHNSEELIAKMLGAIPDEDREPIISLLEQHKSTHGQQQKIDKYFPIVRKDKLSTKFTFDGEETLKTVYYQEDINLDDFTSGFDSTTSFDDDGNEEFNSDSIELLMSTPRTPFLILDHDIHHDGSVRYTSEVQKFGFYKPLAEQFKLFPVANIEFEGLPADFASRTYLGAAAFNKFSLIEENERVYGQIMKQTRRFKKGKSINDRFNLAMLMLNFPWIEQGESEAEDLLLSLSKQGHSPAMFEYGFKLYREQRDIDQAIYWISEASKYGVTKAEYRLAKILNSSPWVSNDEQKALFWFVSAMNKGDVAARINAVEILFTSNDESILDYDLAVEYLAPLEELAVNDPRYHYLNALKYKSGKHRNIKLAVENLERAILRGQMANWDVSDWQDLLSRITTGNVFVTDSEN